MRKAGETSMAGKKGSELARSHNVGGKSTPSEPDQLRRRRTK